MILLYTLHIFRVEGLVSSRERASSTKGEKSLLFFALANIIIALLAHISTSPFSPPPSPNGWLQTALLATLGPPDPGAAGVLSSLVDRSALRSQAVEAFGEMGFLFVLSLASLLGMQTIVSLLSTAALW